MNGHSNGDSRRGNGDDTSSTDEQTVRTLVLQFPLKKWRVFSLCFNEMVYISNLTS